MACKSHNLREVKTFFIGENLLPDGREVSMDEIPKGVLAPTASKVLMKVLSAARMARYDLFGPACALASRVTRWSVRRDKMLRKLMRYINATRKDAKLIGYMGDDLKDLSLAQYTDANLASCKFTKRCASGGCWP